MDAGGSSQKWTFAVPQLTLTTLDLRPCKDRKVKWYTIPSEQFSDFRANRHRSGEEKPACTNCRRQSVSCDYSLRLNWGGRTKRDSLPENVTDVRSQVATVFCNHAFQWPQTTPTLPASAGPTVTFAVTNPFEFAKVASLSSSARSTRPASISIPVGRGYGTPPISGSGSIPPSPCVPIIPRSDLAHCEQTRPVTAPNRSAKRFKPDPEQSTKALSLTEVLGSGWTFPKLQEDATALPNSARLQPVLSLLPTLPLDTPPIPLSRSCADSGLRAIASNASVARARPHRRGISVSSLINDPATEPVTARFRRSSAGETAPARSRNDDAAPQGCNDSAIPNGGSLARDNFHHTKGMRQDRVTSAISEIGFGIQLPKYAAERGEVFAVPQPIKIARVLAPLDGDPQDGPPRLL